MFEREEEERLEKLLVILKPFHGREQENLNTSLNTTTPLIENRCRKTHFLTPTYTHAYTQYTYPSFHKQIFSPLPPPQDRKQISRSVWQLSSISSAISSKLMYLTKLLIFAAAATAAATLYYSCSCLQYRYCCCCYCCRYLVLQL